MDGGIGLRRLSNGGAGLLKIIPAISRHVVQSSRERDVNMRASSLIVLFSSIWNNRAVPAFAVIRCDVAPLRRRTSFP
jgi:hypothetical protein